MAARSSWVGLWLLLLVYVSNQWTRYSLVYLGGVATPECKSKVPGDPCYFDKGLEEVPLCESFQCVSEQCKVCQKCLNEHDAAKKNIKYGTCIDSSQYGILVSYGYMAVFCIVGLFAGRLTDLYSRRNLILGAALAWSMFSILQAASNDFTSLLFSRIGMGFSHAFSGPASLSMIADLFPPESRGQANGIYSFGVYVGGGLSSLSLVMSEGLGWRDASLVIAGCGLLFASIFGLLVKEPKYQAFLEDSASVSENNRLLEPSATEASREDTDQRQNLLAGERTQNIGDRSYQTQPAAARPATKVTVSYMQALSLASQNRAVLLLFVAAPTRFIGGFAIGTFLPQYYKRRFPEMNSQYSTLNALIVSVGGATSAYAGGYITDRLRPKTASAPAVVPALGSALALLPFFGVMYADNFYMSMFCLLLEYLLAESWFGPALSIMQERVPAEARGVTISIYLFISGLVGSLAPLLLGHLDTDDGYEGLQRNITLFVCISYLGTFLVFSAIGHSMRPSSAATTGVQ